MHDGHVTYSVRNPEGLSPKQCNLGNKQALRTRQMLKKGALLRCNKQLNCFCQSRFYRQTSGALTGPTSNNEGRFHRARALKVR